MSSNVLAKAQDCPKGMSHMQASTQATWHLNLLSAGIASGSSQAMLPGGCSTVAMPPLQATATYGLAVSDLFQVLRAEAWEAIQMFRRAQGWRVSGMSLSWLYSLPRLPTNRPGAGARRWGREGCRRLSLRSGGKAGSGQGAGPLWLQ